MATRQKSKSPIEDLNITKELAAAERALRPAVERVKKALAKLKPDKVPQGALVDLLFALRGLSKAVGNLGAPFDDPIAASIKEIEELFVQTLEVGEASGVQGSVARVQVSVSAIPTPEDWPKLYAYIKRTGAFELLGRSLNREAVRERWDAKKQVPGVGVFNVKKVSCTKLAERRMVK